MLDDICSQPVAAGSSSKNHFADFREEEVDVRQLAALLHAAGLVEHWAVATGLPALPD
jgi:hypothetical protein